MKAADLQRVDMGIAMCHFELSANEAGHNGQWTIADPGTYIPHYAGFLWVFYS